MESKQKAELYSGFLVWYNGGNKCMDKEIIEKFKKIALKNNEIEGLSKVKKVIKKPKLIFYVPLWFINKYLFPIKIKYKTFWGESFKFYISEGLPIITKGFFEVNLFNYLLNTLKENMLVIDVGAHIGSYTKLIGKLVGENGKVHSFEPTLRTFNTLKENTKDKANIIINNLALMDKAGEIEFEDYGPKYSYYNGFKKREKETEVKKIKTQKIKVKAITLDDYFKENNINKCDFIKIDAEGAESLILQGMTNILREVKPIISIEVGGGEEWNKNNLESINILEKNNYKLFGISKEGQLVEHVKKDFYEYDNLVGINKGNI